MRLFANLHVAFLVSVVADFHEAALVPAFAVLDIDDAVAVVAMRMGRSGCADDGADDEGASGLVLPACLGLLGGACKGAGGDDGCCGEGGDGFGCGFNGVSPSGYLRWFRFLSGSGFLVQAGDRWFI